jgi:hypothetical protein
MHPLLGLAAQARANYTQARSTREQLSRIDASQSVIMAAITDSVPELAAIQKKLATAEAEIASLDRQIAEVQDSLLEVLTYQPNETQNSDGVLKVLLTNFQDVLLTLARGNAERGRPDVAVLHVIDLEDQITRTIDDMVERGLYPEDENEQHTRIVRREEHTRKIIDFLTFLKAQNAAALDRETAD